MVEEGLDVVRLNYSHDSHEGHAKRVKSVRRISRAQKKAMAVIADLQGPKIRLERFANGPIFLDEGDDFVIDADLSTNAGDENHVGVTYKALAKDVKKGDNLLVDDGRIILQVEKIDGNAIETVVLLGGTLSNNKGINLQGGGLSAKSLTRKDRADLKHALSIGADYIAVSFPRSAKDIEDARRLIKKEGASTGIIAKIERAEAVENAEEIIMASDGIMIARGDLGVEIGDSRLPPVQKQLIDLARRCHRTVITATQMMESMIENPLPTRAEVFDVANAVLDGTDAVMLSGETSIGKHPIKTVEAMAKICLDSETQWPENKVDLKLDAEFERVDQAIAMSAIYCGNRIGVKAIAALTESGATTKWMSRIRTDIPIFALSPHIDTLRKVTLYRGVSPIRFDPTSIDYAEVTKEVLRLLMERGVATDGDEVIITKGDLLGDSGGTNGMKIVTVGNFIQHVV